MIHGGGCGGSVPRLRSPVGFRSAGVLNYALSRAKPLRGQATGMRVMRINYREHSGISGIAIAFIIAFISSRGRGDGSASQGMWRFPGASE